MAQQVVITDDNGMEHVFPEGFDPKKAAAIVRHATGAPPPGSDKEGAANYEQGKKDWLQWHEPMSASAEGFVKEAPSSLYKATIGFVSGAIKTLLGPNAGMGLINDPLGTIMSAYDQAKKLPEVPAHVLKSLEDARNLAVQDPAAFGRAASDVTGAVEVGVATSKIAPVAKGPALRGLGRGLTAVGEHPWMSKVAGGGMLGAGILKGDPALMATGGVVMTAPSAATALGQKMRVMGGESPAVVKLGKKGVTALNEKFDHAMAKRNVSFYDEQQALKAEANKVTAAEELKEGLVAKPPTVTESVTGTTPEGVRKTGAIRYGAKAPEKGGLTPDQQKLLDGLAERNKNIGKDPRFAGTPRRTPPETPVTPAAPVPTPPSPTTPTTPIVPEVVESGAPPKPGTDLAVPVPPEPSSFVALDELSHPTGAAQNTQRFNQNRPVAEAASKAELGYPTGGRSVGPGDAPPNPAPNTRHQMPPAPRMPPEGAERRLMPDAAWKGPERRRPVGMTDEDYAAMQGRTQTAVNSARALDAEDAARTAAGNAGAHAEEIERLAQAEGNLAPDKFPPGTNQVDQALVGRASGQSELDALQAQLKREAMGKINLPSTRTRRGLSSLDTRYSEPDEQIFMDVLASNPTISGEDMVKEIIKRRVGASSTYAAGGHLDTLYNKTKGD